MMNKRGTSLVELIAVIVIMGVIASITTLTVISVVDRQRKNATLNSLNEIYSSTKSLLVQVETDSYDPNITLVDDDFCYISLTTLIESGNVDGDNFKPENSEVYFCYNFNSCWAVITEGDVEKNKPDSTGNAIVNNLAVTFNYSTDRFVIA